MTLPPNLVRVEQHDFDNIVVNTDNISYIERNTVGTRIYFRDGSNSTFTVPPETIATNHPTIIHFRHSGFDPNQVIDIWVNAGAVNSISARKDPDSGCFISLSGCESIGLLGISYDETVKNIASGLCR